ncbi:hypothetical protein JCM11491_004722 [Sporobolomyces phaffii]
MSDDDPARTFFPDVDEIPSLYAVLGVASTCTPDELKRAYRRLALASHPDKAAAAAAASQDGATAATAKFQQIGFAYSVLKDEARRARYDATGSTRDGLDGGDAKTADEWKAYFAELWTGEVTGQTIDQFKREYQGSREELEDLYAAYTAHAGDLESILGAVMCSTEADEPRFVALVDSAIDRGTLAATPQWTATSRDAAGRRTRHAKAAKEEREAEKLAKELGVHEKLYGAGVGDRKGKGKDKGKSDRGDGDEDGDDNAALKALIQGNRDKRMTSLMDSLEAKYGAKKRSSTGGRGAASTTGSKKQKRGKPDHDDDDDAGPTEEEFARIQAELDARRASNASNATGSTKAKGKAKSSKKSR